MVEGFNEELTVVLVFPSCTVWINMGEVLAMKVLVPP